MEEGLRLSALSPMTLSPVTLDAHHKPGLVVASVKRLRRVIGFGDMFHKASRASLRSEVAGLPSRRMCSDLALSRKGFDEVGAHRDIPCFDYADKRVKLRLA